MWNFLLEIISFSVFFGFSILNQIISGQLLHEGKIFSVGYTSHNCMDFLLDLVTEGVSKSYPICTVLSPPASPQNDVHANHTSFSLHFHEWKRFSVCHLSTEGLACVQVFFPVRKQENFWSHEQVGVTSCFDFEKITMRAIESNVWWPPSFTPTEDSCRLTQASFRVFHNCKKIAKFNAHLENHETVDMYGQTQIANCFTCNWSSILYLQLRNTSR